MLILVLGSVWKTSEEGEVALIDPEKVGCPVMYDVAGISRSR